MFKRLFSKEQNAVTIQPQPTIEVLQTFKVNMDSIRRVHPVATAGTAGSAPFAGAGRAASFALVRCSTYPSIRCMTACGPPTIAKKPRNQIRGFSDNPARCIEIPNTDITIVRTISTKPMAANCGWSRIQTSRRSMGKVGAA